MYKFVLLKYYFSLIALGEYHFYDHAVPTSTVGRDLISEILEINPQIRPGISHILSHRYFSI
jgi:hypothetical protein